LYKRNLKRAYAAIFPGTAEAEQQIGTIIGIFYVMITH